MNKFLESTIDYYPFDANKMDDGPSVIYTVDQDASFFQQGMAMHSPTSPAALAISPPPVASDTLMPTGNNGTAAMLAVASPAAPSSSMSIPVPPAMTAHTYAPSSSSASPPSMTSARTQAGEPIFDVMQNNPPNVAAFYFKEPSDAYPPPPKNTTSAPLSSSSSTSSSSSSSGSSMSISMPLSSPPSSSSPSYTAGVTSTSTSPMPSFQWPMMATSSSCSTASNTSTSTQVPSTSVAASSASMPPILAQTITPNGPNNELRRQIHIQSEQKRRAQIKCGFEELRNELPTCLNKKMSKVALLHRTVQHIQHLKSTQLTILAELERLAQENEQLRRFQQSILQKQTIGTMYPMP